MAKRKSSGNKVGLIAIAIILVMLILAILGVCIDWLTFKGEAIGGAVSLDPEGIKLSELFDSLGEAENEIGGAFKTMAAFGILTVILAGATTILAGICKVLGWKLFRFLLVIVAIVCVVSGVVSIITSFTFCDKISLDGGWLAKGTYSPAIGAWLTAIGGALAGLFGVFAAVKS